MKFKLLIKKLRNIGQSLSKMALSKINKIPHVQDLKNCSDKVNLVNIMNGSFFEFDRPHPSAIKCEYQPYYSSGYGSSLSLAQQSNTSSSASPGLLMKASPSLFGNNTSNQIYQHEVRVPPREPWQFEENDVKKKDTGNVWNSFFDLPKQQQSQEYDSFFSCTDLKISYEPLQNQESNLTVNSKNENTQHTMYYSDYSGEQPQRRQFIYNEYGNFKDVETSAFQPKAMSTPYVSRKSNDWQQKNLEMAYGQQQQQQQQPPFYNNYSVYDLYDCYDENFNGISMQLQTMAVSNIRPRRSRNLPPPPKPPRNKKVDKKSLLDHCVFCKNNGEEESVYRSHTVHDAEGRVLCPRLRLYKCPICYQDGDNAHTTKYCPAKPIISPEDLKKMERNRTLNRVSIFH